MPLTDPTRILIIKPSSLGDIVHALPVLAALRGRYPAAHIAWLVGTGFQSLLAGHPMIDELIPFDRAHYGKILRSPRAMIDFCRFVAMLRRAHYDLVIDLQGLLRSGIITWFSRARVRVGFADAREGATLFYSQRVAPDASAIHAVEKNVAFARAIGLHIDAPEFPLGITAAERTSATMLLHSAAGRPVEKFVAMLPGARWETKTWPAEHFARVIDGMHAAGSPPIVLLGAPSEKPTADAIRNLTASPVIDLVGKTNLRQLAAMLEMCERVVCLDSGPMHIAAALGKPIVALFGPTDAARTGPFSPTARVLTHEVACRPCLKRVCRFGHQDCLRKLMPETVVAATENAECQRTNAE
ncbi:MAG: lipopolysaccharide heptosyltransferase I [Phycisphaerae bacterium]